MMVILTIITFGIYLVVWSCMFQSELKKTTGKGFGGFGHFIVSLITFGIYPLVWTFKVGERLEILGCKNNGILYLIISLIGFSPIAYLLMQHEANAVVNK